MDNNTQKSDEKVVIVGFGWVGQANALALVQMGYDVFSYDVMHPKRHYQGSVYAHLYDKITALDAPLAVDGPHTSYMICVGDRVAETGGQDVTFIRQALESIKSAKGTIILRSTIVPKTLASLIFDYYIPEFLHEKFAIQECIRPFYFAIGAGTRNPEAWLPGYVTMWQERAQKVYVGTYAEASYIKYYSNMWNALRIAFVNELGDIIAATSTGEEPTKNAERVINFLFEGKSYVRYGRGFGGHCLPKDMRAFLAAYSGEHNTNILTGTYESNRLHAEFEAKTRTVLPEWFSAWDYESIMTHQRQAIAIIWKKFYNTAIVTALRHFLKPAVLFGERFVPARTLEETRTLWEEKAKANARYYVNQKTQSGEFVDETEIAQTGKDDFERHIKNDERLQSLLPKDKTKVTVLDLGSGIGRISEALAGEYGRVSGIDISPTMVEIAKRRLGEIKNLEFQNTDGATIPYPQETFDLIFSYLVFPHIDDAGVIETYLKEVYRTLKPGGVAKLQLRTGPGVRRWEWSFGLSFTLDEAAQLAQRAGFRVLDQHVEDGKNLWLTLTRA